MKTTTKRPYKARVGHIAIPGDIWERVFGDPNPEVAKPGEWVEVTCRNRECPEFERYVTFAGKPIFEVVPPSCPRCGDELEPATVG